MENEEPLNARRLLRLLLDFLHHLEHLICVAWTKKLILWISFSNGKRIAWLNVQSVICLIYSGNYVNCSEKDQPTISMTSLPTV